MEVLAGNHTLIAARELGWEEIDVSFVEVDTDRAKRIVFGGQPPRRAGDR